MYLISDLSDLNAKKHIPEVNSVEFDVNLTWVLI